MAAAAFTMSRLPRFETHSRPLFLVAFIVAAIGLAIHGHKIFNLILPSHGFDLTMGNAVALIGLELAVIGLMAAVEPKLRGMSGGLIFLAAFTVLLMGPSDSPHAAVAVAWQVRAHVIIALLSYGLLTVGAIVALFALVQERRLQAARLSPVNRLFAPLETTERLLFVVTAIGFAGLTLAIASGTTFVSDLVEQHLTHKFALSLLAWLLFGVLLAGRFFRGWRGKRAIELYLIAFALLCLAYFGSRFILEQVLNRSWS
ncbi:MAG: cytochrome c biogenesis protein CcsA [Woeseiaceae bacterium]